MVVLWVRYTLSVDFVCASRSHCWASLSRTFFLTSDAHSLSDDASTGSEKKAILVLKLMTALLPACPQPRQVSVHKQPPGPRAAVHMAKTPVVGNFAGRLPSLKGGPAQLALNCLVGDPPVAAQCLASNLSLSAFHMGSDITRNTYYGIRKCQSRYYYRFPELPGHNEPIAAPKASLTENVGSSCGCVAKISVVVL
uniref:Putative secreted protein n=1 Tax=Ixodes ricinus TaxID=34613 RepID=A0A6B0V1W3_IXORI